MDQKTTIASLVIFIVLFIHVTSSAGSDRLEWYLPIKTENRQSWQEVRLTEIGEFGLKRKARPKVPTHLHTGIDLMRPGTNYADEPIFPIAIGKVISLRDDGPYAQIILEHSLNDSSRVWSVYEHIAGIACKLGEIVDPRKPIARFMTRAELNKYGWQFDHVHLEIMKLKPLPRTPDKQRPFLHYGTYCLTCYSQKDLDKRYYNPKEFLELTWKGTDDDRCNAK